MSFPTIQSIECGTARDFLELLSPIGATFGKHRRYGSWLYRGQGSDAWKLLPSAFRPEKERELFSLAAMGAVADHRRKNVIRWLAESQSVEHFFLRADRAGLPLPEDSQLTRDYLHAAIWQFKRWAGELDKPPDDQNWTAPATRLGPLMRKGEHEWIPHTLVSFVAIAQHYGIPTRLLDWSYSPYTAAYFSARQAIHSKTTNPKCTVHAFLIEATDDREFYLQNFRSKGLVLNLVTAPRAANPNLHAQEGVFTCLEPVFEPPGFDINPLAIDDVLASVPNPNPNESPVLVKCTLNVGQARELLRLLERLGVDAGSLFPGFSGAAQAAMEFLDISETGY